MAKYDVTRLGHGGKSVLLGPFITEAIVDGADDMIDL